jgi:D-glycero-D-manno-heptose 1,7-bisphosphate phosphatase
VQSGIFLDRDGTINREVGYLDDPDKVELLPGSALAIRLLNRLGIPVVIISNQSGVARGYLTSSAVEEVNGRLQDLLLREGARLQGIHYCPHSPEDGCDCRKPKPGLLLLGAEVHGIDLKKSYLVGDHGSDVEAVQRVGGKGVLVLSGHGQEEAHKNLVAPDFIARDLLEAVYWIMLQTEIKEHTMVVSKELLDILACPKCKGDVELTEQHDGLLCRTCGVVYPIKDDIPVMLIDEAIPVSKQDGK